MLKSESFTNEAYTQQLTEKKFRLAQMIAEYSTVKLEIFSSKPKHYRMRAEFRIWHEGDELYHIMFDPVTRQRIRVDQFPAASLLINQLMQELIDHIQPVSILRDKLFQIDYLTSTNQQAVVSLLYHHPLSKEWEWEAKQLKDTLNNKGFNVQLIGRAAKQKICLDHDYVDECLTINGTPLIYRQIENSFTQSNAGINVAMLEWVLRATKDHPGDLLELYCGNGNFSLALARNFRQVLATEISKSSVLAAQHNIQINQINNVKILRMSVEELTQAIQKTREFHRLKDIALDSYQCDTLFVNPPRCGLDVNTLNLAKQFKYIIYISCNTNTLINNINALKSTHYLERVALFDQFPYTSHMECGVILQKY